MEEAKAIAVLSDIKSVFDDLGLVFWLESGTLLGAYREGKFLSWDSDIDLGTSDVNLKQMPIISEEFSKRDFASYYSQYNNVLALYKNGISVDFNFKRFEKQYATMPLRYSRNILGKILYFIDWIILSEVSGKVSDSLKNGVKYPRLRYFLVRFANLFPITFRLKIARFLNILARFSGNSRGLVVVPVEYCTNLKSITFYNEEYQMPENIEGYLVYYFGTSWKTPDSNWKVKISRTERVGEKWVYRKLR